MGNYYTNELGQVAVLITREYGTGWFTYHGIWRLCVDPELCRAVDEGDLELALELAREIVSGDNFQEFDTWIGLEDLKELQVCWVDRHKKFFIHEYDGLESVWYKHEIDWTQL